MCAWYRNKNVEPFRKETSSILVESLLRWARLPIQDLNKTIRRYMLIQIFIFVYEYKDCFSALLQHCINERKTKKSSLRNNDNSLWSLFYGPL